MTVLLILLKATGGRLPMVTHFARSTSTGQGAEDYKV